MKANFRLLTAIVFVVLMTGCQLQDSYTGQIVLNGSHAIEDQFAGELVVTGGEVHILPEAQVRPRSRYPT